MINFNNTNGSIEGDIKSRSGGIAIANGKHILRRQTDIQIHKLLNKHNLLLQYLNDRKNSLNATLSTLNPSRQGYKKLIEQTIKNIDYDIEYVTFIISQIQQRINVLNSPISDTKAKNNDRENDFIFNIHNYSNFIPVAFAPTYPIRF